MSDATGERRVSGGPPSDVGGRILRFPERIVPSDPAPPVRRATFRLAWLLLPAALGALAGGYVVRERAVTFQVVSGRISDGGYVSSGAAEAIVRFSDRSDLVLEPGTRLRVSDLQVRGARVMLEGGAVHVNARARRPGTWSLDAGPYIVHLSSGQLDLTWNADTQQLELMLHDGSATVEGPSTDSWLKIGPRQHVVANAKTGALSLDVSNPGL